MSSEDKIYELLDLLSQDNLKVTIHSDDAVEKLSLHLSWMLSEIDEDSSLLPSFLSRGILDLINFFEKVFNQILASCEINSKLLSSLEDVLEILSSISETRIKTKCKVVLQFGEILYSYINQQSLPFEFRLKVVKYTNLLFENCPSKVKDFLYSKASFKNNLKEALKSIFVIGDYEFQVGIIEGVFRAISKQKRVESLKALCPQKILHSVLAIKDESFEADCRRVLNAFNSQQGHQQRVFSIPCFGVTLGNLQLQKPKDDNYKEFWIDFNASSKRISFYCSQVVDSEDPQEADEDVWETICIRKDYIEEISSNDDDEVYSVQFTFFPLSMELFPGFTLEKYPSMKILFKDKYATMKAIHEIFSKQKCSIAENEIYIKKDEKLVQAKKLLPSTSEDLYSGQDPSIASSQLSTTRSVRKSSIPSDIWVSQNSTDSRHEVGAIQICQPFPSLKSSNSACNIKKTDSTQMSKSKVSNVMVAENQPCTQSKMKNSDLQSFKNPAVLSTSNVEEKTSQISKSRKCRVFDQNKKAQHKNSKDIKDQTDAYNFNSEEEDEIIPPTFEIKPPSKDSIQSKKLINPSITSNYKQDKTLSTTKNSGDADSNISSSVRLNPTNDQKLSQVKKKQNEIIGEKRENKSLQNQKISLQKDDWKHCENTQLKKGARSNDLNKPTEYSVISSNHDITSNNTCPTNKAESLHASKAQSFRSQSVFDKNSSDKNISSEKSTEKNTTASRKGKGRRLRSFEFVDLLPQNYPLPKDKHSAENSKNINTSKKQNSSTHNITSKHLEEDKVVSIKETQPEPEEIILIPDSLPHQIDIGNPEEDQPIHESSEPAKPSVINKPPIDSGISSVDNSLACMNELPSTILKTSDVSPEQNQGNLSAKPTKSLLPSEKKSVSTTDVKTNNETGKTLKTSNSKPHMDDEQNESNKSVSNEEDESYQLPNSKVPSLQTEPQVPCYAPITEDNLSKFNKRVQNTLAKELDERIENFVRSSWQSVPELANAAPLFPDDTKEKDGEHKSTSLQSDKDAMHDKTNGRKDLVENNPLPRKISPKVHAESRSVVNIKEKQLVDQPCSSLSMNAKTPSQQKENKNIEIYEVVKLGPVASFSNDSNRFTTKCKQIEDKCQEKNSSSVFSAQKKDKVEAASKKPPLLTNRSKSLDSAKPSIGSKVNKNTGRIYSSPTEKLFKMSPLKRRSFPLKRADENKKGYDPYDFDCSSSVENFPPPETSTRPSETNIASVKNKKKDSILREGSVLSDPQPQISKRKIKLQFSNPKSPLGDSYKFEKDGKKNAEQDVAASPICVPDSDCDSPQPKKRAKLKPAKSKVTANLSLPSPKRNSNRASIRKRKDINYKEVSSVDSSASSLLMHDYEPKKKNPPIKQKRTFFHNDAVYNISENEDGMKDTSSLGNASHTQPSEVSWIKSDKSNSPKIRVQKTYAVKKKPAYYGSYACIPKRKSSESPKKNNKRNKANEAKKTVNKELPTKENGHNASLQQYEKTDRNSSPKSFGAKSPEHPKKICHPRHDKENHVFSFSSDFQMKNKTKQKKKCVKETFLSDSIEIKRADSFVMFPDESKLNISILDIESDTEERSKHRTPSFSNNISDLELTLPTTEDPKLLIPVTGDDSSIASLNDSVESIEPISSHSSKLMPFSSPVTIDDLKSNSDKQEESITSYLDKNQFRKKRKSLSSLSNFSLEEDLSHSTPMKDYDLKLSPLYAGDGYKSKTSFRKTLFSEHKSHDSNDSKKSSIHSAITINKFRFHGSSLEKGVNFYQSPVSDKSTDTDSDDESSSKSSSDESKTNDSGPYNLLLPSDKSSHFQEKPPVGYKDDSIKNIIGSFTHNITKSVQTRQHKVSTVVEEIVKNTQKALNKICENDDHNRSEVHLEFNKKIEHVMNKLEDSTKSYEEQKTKMLNNLQGEMKDLQKIRDTQQKSLEKLKMINSLYHEKLTSAVKSNQTEHQVQKVMKSQMQKLQSKLLDQARQDEMQQMRKQLHKMLL